MYLRSLTIKGFKSFARRTVLEFEPGVTIIVGPNGAGKSNIADAVMWVLGEQSPTSLRGNRMEDVIFAGSASLKPVNLAEVVLTLDNSNNIFPLDYSEITVSRNVVRGGDSEYRLNSSACRLLDIQELLSDAGVGRTLNSVISQGQLDEVLSCRPEERRDYIEEAGGLLKYRRRREKAVRRLARMEEELVRTNDVMREVRRQLRPLQRQAGRLEQYQSLTRELSHSQLRLDVARLRSMQKEWKGHQELQSERAGRLEELDRELASKAKDAVTLDDDQTGWRTREADLREILYRLVSIHERLKATLGFGDGRGGRLFRQLPDPAALASIREANLELEGRVSELEAECAALRLAETEASAGVFELNRLLNDTARQVAAMEARLEVLSTAEGEIGMAGSRFLEQKSAEIESLSARRDGIQVELDASGVRVLKSEERVAGLEEEVAAARARARAASRGLRAAAGAPAGRQATLERRSRRANAGWGVLNVTASLKRDDPTGGGLGGTLAESIKIQEQYESSVMSFLGPWAFGLIARDADAIKQAVGHLKARGLGQSLFFRHTPGGPARRHGERGAPEGSIMARDVVEAPEWFEEPLDTLLEDVFIVPDLDTAFRLADRDPGGVFLTREGDVISGGNMVKGGSLAVNPVHLEMTARRREKMEEALAETRSRAEVLELELRAAEVEDLRISELLVDARESLTEARTAAARDAGSLSDCRSRIEAAEAEIAAFTGREGEAHKADADLQQLEARLEELRGRYTDAERMLEEAESARKRAATDAEEASARLAAVSREVDAGRAKESVLAEEMEFAGASPGEADCPGGDLQGRLKSVHRHLIEHVSRLREKVRVEIEEGALGAEDGARRLRAMREDIGKLQDMHEELREQIHQEDLSRAELKILVEQLVERVVDGHKVPLEFAFKRYPAEEPTPEMEQEVGRLAARLEHIGPVNPEAIAEREALEQRFELLKTQLEDIDESKVKLRRVVRQVDREIEEKFKQTLDEVNAHFQQIFESLFPNGSAQLQLTEPDDLLASGVEIMAQPEGKRLRRISLLSGGETSLTALAFFFALFRVRPSPFYFLDEVEAALDDVNLHRFLDMVKQFKNESQLVLITHQKRSMEIADILYGVTMQEDGISRVVSQKVAG